MAVYTFSTKEKKPQDTEMVERIKAKCSDQGRNFSALMISLLWKHEHDERARKVQDNK